MTAPIIVADAGPLIALAKLDQLVLLKQVFSVVHVPKAVCQEVTRDPARRDARQLVEFLAESAQQHSHIQNDFTHVLRRSLDEGEIQALVLAKQLGCGVLMDELRGRKLAEYYSITVVGVLGVLMQAKQKALLPKIAPLVGQLQQENYRLSPALVSKVLKQAGEAEG